MSKISVVTGGASGLGYACAECLGKSFEVLISDVNQEKLDEAVKNLSAKGVKVTGQLCDVSDREQVKKLAQKAAEMGDVANVLNAAGISHKNPNGPAARVFAINGLGAAYVMAEFFPLLKEGSVHINITSSAPYVTPEEIIPVDDLRLDPFSQEFKDKNTASVEKFGPGLAYSFSKWFVLDYGLRSTMRYGRKGVRILSVSPGNVTTPMYYNEVKEDCDTALPYTPLGRHGTPEEVGEVVAFLASDGARFLSGIDIQIGGGWLVCAPHSSVYRPQLED